MATESFTLKSAQFRREREAYWRELESLLEKLEREGPGSLTHDEVMRLPSLHRMATSSLSVARAISLDRNVLEYLTSLACRSHLVVYGGHRRPRRTIDEFFRARLPRIVRGFGGLFAVASAVLVAGILVGFVMTSREPARFYSFVPESLVNGRGPEASTDSLRASLHHGFDAHSDTLSAFATFLFHHNATVGLLCLFLGFAAGLPVIYLLFSNGLGLGAFAALFASRGLAVEFWGWVLPHGVSELLALLLCGTAGLVYGTSLVFPGRESRLDVLAHRGRLASLMVVGAVGLFFIASLFEGIFRQLVQSTPVRYAVAALMLGVWIAYFGFASRGDSDVEREG